MKIHFVKKGDTLYLISRKYNVTVDEIVAVNPSITDPNQIEIGMKLVIPDKSMPKVPTPSPKQEQIPAAAPIAPMVKTPIPKQTHIPMPMPAQMPTPVYPQKTIEQPQTGFQSKGVPYSGQSIPPFAEIPVPAYPAAAWCSNTYIPEWGPAPTYAAQHTQWPGAYSYMPPEFSDYAMIHGAQGLPEYPSYPIGMMQPVAYENYEFYSTYSAMKDSPLWSPHSSMGEQSLPYQETLSKDANIAGENKNVEEIETEAKEPRNSTKKKAKTSSSDKSASAVKKKKPTLRDELARMQQSGRTADLRERHPSRSRPWTRD